MNDTTVTTASAVVAALEAAWNAIAANVTDLPDVVLIIGSGAAGGEWGHTWYERWVAGDLPAEPGGATSINPATRRTEVFIAGERLACGAVLTLQTLLHEAAHVLARVRGIQDVSRQGRYHNQRFAQLAGQLGLAHPVEADGSRMPPHPVYGFSTMVIQPATVRTYRPVIDGLDEQIKLYLDLPDGLDANAATPPRRGRRSGGGAPIPAHNLGLACCECAPPRKIRVAPATLAVAPIVCRRCDGSFHYLEEASDETR